MQDDRPLASFSMQLSLQVLDKKPRTWTDFCFLPSLELLRHEIPLQTCRQIDEVMARTSHLTHFFWSGQLLHYPSKEHSVESIANDIAQSRGGITLEGALRSFGVTMPDYSERDNLSVTIWTYASACFAQYASGDVYVIYGEWINETTSVWLNTEYPALRANPKVGRIWKIQAHYGCVEGSQQIWSSPVDRIAAS
ncbi:hypothetical protein DL96DRAFT_1678605 [Flagelloscypha sp. PMI_526]|nr:hypothetical protein DL96DRAFT_1678605 [Flagelloscypha sp. PMI_526]